MAEEVLVEVSNLSKKFCKDLKKSLWYGVKDVVGGAFGKAPGLDLRKDEFWALKDINFTLKRGECLGLIGHNGAGKSTLLKILNGLLKPDAGSVTMRGKVGALIELGAGFNPILSGRENIYNNGAVLGFSKQEIDAKLEEIIDFAEVREFIEMPVKNYSSGMRVRLGFAVAAQLEPDVLIIDEVLAVGDISFRAKCYERIAELLRSCCVILVTHSMPQISKVCTSSILLNKGEILLNGENGNVIEKYYDSNTTKAESGLIYSDRCELIDFTITEFGDSESFDCFELELKLKSEIALNDIELNVIIMSRELIPVCQASSKINRQQLSLIEGENRFKMVIDDLRLNTGLYRFSLTVDSIHHGKKYLWMQNVDEIIVKRKHTGISPVLISKKWINV